MARSRAGAWERGKGNRRRRRGRRRARFGPATDAPCHSGPYPILLECNVSGESAKYGLSAADLPAVLDAILPLEHLQVEGLMTMAPFVADPETVRPVFAALRELADEARARTGLPLPHLSMGMTQDFEVAIEEGATMVRVGSALSAGV
ncbi:alanine racemase [Planctomycetota bacterium]